MPRGRGTVLSACAVALAILACPGNHGDLVDQECCRANMNALATDLIVFFSLHGEWPEDLSEIDDFAQRRRPLVCPMSGEEYLYDLSDSGYVISCPCGEHGCIIMGRPSWVAGEESNPP